jgi:hypothetical protein
MSGELSTNPGPCHATTPSCRLALGILIMKWSNTSKANHSGLLSRAGIIFSRFLSFYDVCQIHKFTNRHPHDVASRQLLAAQ